MIKHINYRLITIDGMLIKSTKPPSQIWFLPRLRVGNLLETKRFMAHIALWHKYLLVFENWLEGLAVELLQNKFTNLSYRLITCFD